MEGRSPRIVHGLGRIRAFCWHLAVACGRLMALQLLLGFMGIRLEISGVFAALLFLGFSIYAAWRTFVRPPAPRAALFEPFFAALAIGLVALGAFSGALPIDVSLGLNAVCGVMLLASAYAVWSFWQSLFDTAPPALQVVAARTVLSLGCIFLAACIAWQVPGYARNVRARTVLENL